MAANKYNLERWRITSAIVFNMGDVNGGDSEEKLIALPNGANFSNQ